MMPELWPSRRVIARCVLPVFVGPSTARTLGANMSLASEAGPNPWRAAGMRG